MIKYVGFDKDGTLFDTISTYAKIWGEIFHKDYGIDASKAGEYLIQTAGQPTALQVFNLLSENNILISKEDAFKKANEIAEILGQQADAKLFPEVFEVLKNLKDDGFKIFISSGQQEDVVKRDLEKSGLMQFTDFYAGIKPQQVEYYKGRPHFEATAKKFGVSFESFVKQAIFVGDTQTDVDISKENNILCIIRKNQNQVVTGENFLVDNFSNLEQIIKGIS